MLYSAHMKEREFRGESVERKVNKRESDDAGSKSGGELVMSKDLAEAELLDDCINKGVARDERGVPTREACETVSLLVGIPVELDEQGLPTRETLEALAAKGAVGRIIGQRLIADDRGDISPEQEKVLEMFNDRCNALIDPEAEQRRHAEVGQARDEVYRSLLPYDTQDNATGQEVAEWMRARMQFGVFDRQDAVTWRTPLKSVTPEALRELDRIVGQASASEFRAIFPGLSERDYREVLNDPHIKELVIKLSGNIDDEKLIVQIGEIAALRRYVASLPYSIGGLREILTSLAESAIGRVQLQARDDAAVAEMLRKALSAHDLPNARSAASVAPKTTGAFAGLTKKMRGWFGGGDT